MITTEAKKKICPYLQVNGTNQQCIANECMAWEVIGPNTGNCIKNKGRN
jgi:hypothetical protein